MARIRPLIYVLTALFAAPACGGDIYRIERPGEGEAGEEGEPGAHDCGPGDEGEPTGEPGPGGDAPGGDGAPAPGGEPGVIPGDLDNPDPDVLPEPVDYDRYVTEVNLLLTLSCGGCHANGAGGYTLSSNTNDEAHRANYDGSVARSNTLAPTSSILLTKALGVAHGGGATWPGIEDCRYRITLAWIEGAERPQGCEGFLP